MQALYDAWMQNQSESEFLYNVGERLTSFRRHQGLSQDYVAEKAGITQCYLSEAERGKRNITLKVLYSVAKVLNVEPKELLNFDSLYISEFTSNDKREIVTESDKSPVASGSGDM